MSLTSAAWHWKWICQLTWRSGTKKPSKSQYKNSHRISNCFSDAEGGKWRTLPRGSALRLSCSHSQALILNPCRTYCSEILSYLRRCMNLVMAKDDKEADLSQPRGVDRSKQSQNGVQRSPLKTTSLLLVEPNMARGTTCLTIACTNEVT